MHDYPGAHHQKYWLWIRTSYWKRPSNTFLIGAMMRGGEPRSLWWSLSGQPRTFPALLERVFYPASKSSPTTLTTMSIPVTFNPSC